MHVLFIILYCVSFTECSMITCKNIEDALGLGFHSDYVSTLGAGATSETVSWASSDFCENLIEFSLVESLSFLTGIEFINHFVYCCM